MQRAAPRLDRREQRPRTRSPVAGRCLARRRDPATLAVPLMMRVTPSPSVTTFSMKSDATDSPSERPRRPVRGLAGAPGRRPAGRWSPRLHDGLLVAQHPEVLRWPSEAGLRFCSARRPRRQFEVDLAPKLEAVGRRRDGVEALATACPTSARDEEAGEPALPDPAIRSRWSRRPRTARRRAAPSRSFATSTPDPITVAATSIVDLTAGERASPVLVVGVMSGAASPPAARRADRRRAGRPPRRRRGPRRVVPPARRCRPRRADRPLALLAMSPVMRGQTTYTWWPCRPPSRTRSQTRSNQPGCSARGRRWSGSA